MTFNPFYFALYYLNLFITLLSLERKFLHSSRVYGKLDKQFFYPFRLKSQQNEIRIRQFNRPLPSSKNSHFQNEARCTTFLWKWVLFAWEWKTISISKAEHVPLFWNRGRGELGNGVLWYIKFNPQLDRLLLTKILLMHENLANK